MHSLSTRRARCWSLFAAAVVWATAGPAGAFTIYDNFGPGDSFSSAAYSLGFDIRNAAVSFEVGASDIPFILDSIEVALQGSGGGEGIDVKLALDDAGQPGAVLETASLYIFGTPSIRTASFSGATLIDTPGTYWVWLEMTSGSNFSWLHNDQGVLGSYVYSDDAGSSWDPWSPPATEPAFRVNAVPEPSTALLLAFGLMALAAGRRRH